MSGTLHASPPTPDVASRLEVACQNCGAALALASTMKTARCPYCDSPSVIERPGQVGKASPRFVLGFSVTEGRAKDRARAWLKRHRLFAPAALRRARFEEIRGVYLPAYLYSSLAQTRYEADIAESYTETETYTTTEGGKTVQRTRTVTRTEWRPLQGAHETYVVDVLVSASQGLPNEELQAIEPFDLRLLRRYAPALLSGWAAEEPSMTAVQGTAVAREEVEGKVRGALEGFLPGDGHRNLAFQTQLQHESAELCLVPVWVLAVRWDERKPPFRLLLNGQTGKLHGEPPVSALRVLLFVLVLAGLVAGLLVASGVLHR